MGGFHGGVGGGGGRSGGGSRGGGGGFHGGGGPHYGGGPHSNYRPPVRIGYHHHGHIYYRPYYGTSNGKPMTFRGAVTLGLILMGVGLTAFVSIYHKPCTATILTTSTVTDGYNSYKYEEYTFSYNFNDKTYTGYGEDDLNYDGTYTVNKGEHYTVYVGLIDHTSYQFESNNAIAYIFAGFLIIPGAAVLGSAISKNAKFKRDLKEIGDVNGDGKIDEKDLEYDEKINKATTEGATQAAKENAYDEVRYSKAQYCTYCGCKLSDNDKRCPSCGANVSEN